jgi:hypothetical protein
MNIGRSNDCNYKKERMVKRNNISRKRGKKLKQHNNYRWTLINYLYTLRNKLKCSEWNYFVKKIKQLSKNVQE